jgi:iron(III) transport system substrate-binding protein
VKLIEYDFAAYGESNRRRHILQRWEREIGSLPR